MSSQRLSCVLRLLSLLALVTLLSACAARRLRYPLVAAEALPAEIDPDPPRLRVAHACECDTGLVCCNPSCGICAARDEPCPALACE
jgi:hypothetical protein